MSDLQRNLTLYLAARGWQANLPPGRAGRLWDHEKSGLSVAVPNELRPGSMDWLSIATRLAEVERTSVEAVEAAISRVDVDVANLRAANHILITDTIPYSAGSALMQNAWRMFRSCATTSMRPRSQIRSNYNRRADEIAATARMAHTRRGSFIIPLLLPVSEPVPLDEGLVNVAPPEPMERRVMRTFAESLASVQSLVVVPEREPSTDDTLELMHAGVCAEFATSLHHVLTEAAVAEFGAAFEWAPVAGDAPENLCGATIPAEAAPRVLRVAERLREVPDRQEVEVLTGPIVAAERDAQQGGLVIIDTFRNSRSARVGVRITDDARFDAALDWMKRRTTVVIDGAIARANGMLLTDRDNAVEPLAARQLPEIG